MNAFPSKEERNRPRFNMPQKLVILVGAIAIAGGIPIKDKDPHFPKGSTPISISKEERDNGVLVASEVPNDALDQVDCGGEEGALLYDFMSVSNSVRTAGTNSETTRVICLKPGADADTPIIGPGPHGPIF